MNPLPDPTLSGPRRTRRQFLRSSLLGTATGWAVPGFVARTMQTLQAGGGGAPMRGGDGRILVVLQLAGGNDGLNTVVPFTDDAYHRARPSLALSKTGLHALDDQWALAPALGGLKRLYDEGHLAVVQGVGYPSPNRSHFRSTEIWQGATDAGTIAKTGWLGRYFDVACADAPNPTVGVSLSDQVPQSFRAEKNSGIAMTSPDLYRWVHDADAAMESAFEALNTPDPDDLASGGSIVMLAGGRSGGERAESPLAFLERTALNAQTSSAQVRSLARKSHSVAAYPANNRLAQSLQLVSQFIAGGLPARVYAVNHGGFDTHNNQGGDRGPHQNLLRQFDEALAAFMADLKARGLLDQVLVMTFSEFGRRVHENGSGGTDHGTAAPLFMCGGGVNGGIHGAAPGLTDLDNGDLKFTTDFRSVYATVLDRWLAIDPSKVLGKPFPSLDVLG